MMNSKFINKKAVILDKNIKGGIPCVEGTRIPVENIVYLNKTKRISPEKIAIKYYTQISIDKVKATLDWFEKNKGKYEMAL